MSALGQSGSAAHAGLTYPQVGLRRSAAFQPSHVPPQNKASPVPHAASPYQQQAYAPQQPSQGNYPHHLFNQAGVNGNVTSGPTRAAQSHVPGAVVQARQRAAPPRQQTPSMMYGQQPMSQPMHSDSIMSHQTHQAHQTHQPHQTHQSLQHQSHPSHQNHTTHQTQQPHASHQAQQHQTTAHQAHQAAHQSHLAHQAAAAAHQIHQVSQVGHQSAHQAHQAHQQQVQQQVQQAQQVHQHQNHHSVAHQQAHQAHQAQQAHQARAQQTPTPTITPQPQPQQVQVQVPSKPAIKAQPPPPEPPAQPQEQHAPEPMDTEAHAENGEDESTLDGKMADNNPFVPRQPMGEMMSAPPEGGSFPTLEAVHKSVLQYCTSVGYAIVIGRSKKTVPGLKKVLFVCDRAGKPPSRVSPEARKRKTSSRKCDCPFGFFAIEQRTQWTIRYRPDPTHLSHNHGPSESPLQHPAARKLDSKMVAAVKTLKDSGVGVSQTLEILQTENPHVPLLPRDIYNARAAINRNPQKVATGIAENRPAIYSKPHPTAEERIRADLRRELAKAREELDKIKEENKKEVEALKATIVEKDKVIEKFEMFIDICNQRVMVQRERLEDPGRGVASK